MLLAFDIGNTTIAIGLFRGKKLLHDWRLEADREKTCDEYAVLIHSLFQMAGLSPRKLEGVIISSVVPPLTPVFEALGKNVFGVKPLVVGPGLRTGLPILYENPAEVGADRIVAAVAAFEKYGGPAKVIATGGFGGEIVPEVPAIAAYEPTLVLDGLRLVYERNKRR